MKLYNIFNAISHQSQVFIFIGENITITNSSFENCFNLNKIKVLEDFDEDEIEINEEITLQNVVKKGNCGDKCNWIYDTEDKIM